MPLNYISLEVVNRIPLDGVDTHIVCNGCDALCCREGTIMPLTEKEISFMQDGGTELERYTSPHNQIVRRIVNAVMMRQEIGDRKLMRLNSDCGYLANDSEAGRLICSVYSDDQRPKVCGEFKMGSYACGIIQLSRLSKVLTCDDGHQEAEDIPEPIVEKQALRTE